MTRLYKRYQEEIRLELGKKLGKASLLAVPKIDKVVVNMGIGDIAKDKTMKEKAISSIIQLTGQRPESCVAKKAVAEFKTRKGDVIGLRVTLRRKRAYDFLDKLFSLVLPQVRDFQGLSLKGFDGCGNYSLGLAEQIIFPEVDYDTIDRIRGLEITIVTTSKEDKEAKKLLKALGMPFKKRKKKSNN